ncbi:response regulator [Nesterenkonia sandarakina]|uniref:LuxR family two component transcriptional regulator n=1 Tax=Nesterenkonia sandarakina TaxID=272918 RepID=A0A2T0YDM9_9MICC|nr:response regulator transcription factor [Nesterenkonia sandarakina]PRZ12939.1 LuxR family two component transcriptional regulator [Nesterenkonia sandarakina]
MIRVLLTDDQHLVRTGLRALLENDSEIEVIGEASNGEESLDQVKKLHPDVVLMDIRMPVMNGVDATSRIKESERSPAVLILTTFDDDDEVLSAIRAGAAGYLLKDTSGPRLREAVRAVAAGESQLSPQIMRKLMDHVAAGPPAGDSQDFSVLTERELQVLKAVAQGRTNSEIAAELYLSSATARTYVSRILTKLDARDRTELAILAHRAGLDGLL